MSESLSATTVTIGGHGGDEIEAYLALPTGDGPRGGVVVIHHMPGYDRATKEIVRRFAELGYDAICPNLYWRQAPAASSGCAPLLGLFGQEDSHPSPEQVAELDEILTAHGKPHEFHSYDDAGHAFFAVDRPAYRVAAANDGWERIAAFYTTHLGG